MAELHDDGLVTFAERCGSCAFREGTEASRSPLTILKAQLCLQTAELFLCHEDSRRIAICRGWADALIVRHEKGIPFEESEWKRELLLETTELISRFEDATHAGEPFDIDAEMFKITRRMCEASPDATV